MNRHNRLDLGIIHPLILMTIIPALTSTGYGYDSASSCDPNASRKGRSSQLLQAIPCDLSMQAYCNLPGSVYPWHAVRRFVHENQGLMRRMYGDVRHISVLKSEIDNNEIDIDDVHRTAERYSRMDTGKKMKLAHPSHYEYGRDKNNDIITEPHFRPAQKSTTPKTTTSPTSTTSAKPPVDNNTTAKPTFLNITLTESSTSEQIVKLNQSDVNVNNKDGEKIDMLKLSTIANLETYDGTLTNVSFSNIDTDNINETKPNNLTNPVQVNASNTENYSVDNNADKTTSISPETDRDDKLTEGPAYSSSENLVNLPSETNGEANDQGNRIETTKTSKNTSKKPEGQLFQDTAQKEPPLLNVRGVNACPVKEEVVAPFWANNTRGEVLALLNLYPFEQYVHWEKCAFEFKQMYCREGCRCEQQYRLHRLLAYDPHNECRGIFSDWFRFPSCCICKCYDLPFDFRVTSRSPRIIVKESIQYIEDELQNAIYDHATDEWYRPKDFGSS